MTNQVPPYATTTLFLNNTRVDEIPHNTADATISLSLEVRADGIYDKNNRQERVDLVQVEPTNDLTTEVHTVSIAVGNEEMIVPIRIQESRLRDQWQSITLTIDDPASGQRVDELVGTSVARWTLTVRTKKKLSSGLDG